MSSKKNILIIGAGFSGSVVAHKLAKEGYLIDVWDERSHIGGNCYTYEDEKTGITVHKYGPHIFNTDNKEVWDFVNSLDEFVPFINRVKTVHKDTVYSMPINLHTINQFFNKKLSPSEAEEFVQNLGLKSIETPKNFEEQALKFIGTELYEAFFKNYTIKQWGCDPKELPASILKRLPVRFDYNDNYYNSHYQGIPKNGYTILFEKMLNHENIELSLDKKFKLTNTLEKDYEKIFYSGAIDELFDYKYGRLSYRTVNFEKHEVNGDYQGNAVINYPDLEYDYTRIHEHKHFTPWKKFDKSLYFKEYSKETEENDVPFYPKRLKDDMEKLEKYNNEVKLHSKIIPLGRLATYRYMDMHHVIQEAMDLSNKFISNSI